MSSEQAAGQRATIVVSVRPAPEPDVLAAIVAAVEEAWPRPLPALERQPRNASWRFSGRWWSRPTPARRDRPWTA